MNCRNCKALIEEIGELRKEKKAVETNIEKMADNAENSKRLFQKLAEEIDEHKGWAAHQYRDLSERLGKAESKLRKA